MKLKAHTELLRGSESEVRFKAGGEVISKPLLEHGEAGGLIVPFGTTRFLDLGASGEKQRAQQ